MHKITAVQFAFDKHTETVEQTNNIKYIARSYKDGKIIYFEENDPMDGFGLLINELQNEKSAVLYVPKNKTLPILEFLTELSFSVVNASLTLVSKNNKNWKSVNYPL